MTNPSISLKEFISKSKKELKEFENLWSTSSVDDPIGWPIEMTEADWYEQFLVHISDE